jgi:hypothetical protein
MSDTKSGGVTVTELLEEIANDFCDNYCKYPSEYTDMDKLVEERCEKCPLMKI